MEILRLTSAGSVDDGKSTLIGRLLYDTKSIFEDQLDSLQRLSQRRNQSEIDLALITDGLRAEREQGITIDVAYRYFTTPKRKFILADVPGHLQYTRNMITGASTANLAIILVDARTGIVEQTKRHSYIASLFRIPHLILCVNKMDLVGWDQIVFDRIAEEFNGIAAKLEIKDICILPVSALLGDNVVNKSENMPWYNGSSLLFLLENLHISSDYNHSDARFPVQYVVRPKNVKGFEDYRGFSGKVASGIFRFNDDVTVLPSGINSRIRSIMEYNNILDEAFPTMSIAIELEDNIDVSRGDMIIKTKNKPLVSNKLDCTISCFDNNPLSTSKSYILRHTTNEVSASFQEIIYKVDINSLKRNNEIGEISMNDIFRARIKTSKPIFYDPYETNRITGSFILIDEGTFNTIAVGIIN